MLHELLPLYPQGLGFYNTAQARHDLGYAQPHELTLDLQRVRQMGYVVLQGEGLTGSTDRWAHRHNNGHNWMPDRVVIVPRAVFKARQRWAWQGWKYRRLGTGEFEGTVSWLNSRPDGGGRRPRVTGQYLASLAPVPEPQ